MSNNDYTGLRSYTAPPLGARVCEQRLSEPLKTVDSVTRAQAFLQDEIAGGEQAITEAGWAMLACEDAAWAIEIAGSGEDRIDGLRTEYRAAKQRRLLAIRGRWPRRFALEREVREVAKERHPRESLLALSDRDMRPLFGDHYDACDGCSHPQCTG